MLTWVRVSPGWPACPACSGVLAGAGSGYSACGVEAGSRNRQNPRCLQRGSGLHRIIPYHALMIWFVIDLFFLTAELVNVLRTDQDTIYYKWASVKMKLKFHFLWSTLFSLEQSVSAVYSDWFRGKSDTKSCSWSVADVWRRHLELLHIICTPGVDKIQDWDYWE